MGDVSMDASFKKKERRVTRREVLANFQFYIDQKSKEIFEGLTMNISPHGFGFLTGIVIGEGQTITITKHSLPGFAGYKAKATWVKKRPRYFEAGAKFNADI